MASRTVRLDRETEKVLEQIVRATGLSLSAALKQGLLTLGEDVGRRAHRRPYDVYRELDLGPGGYAIAPSTRTRDGVRAAIRRKLQP
jgi:hypothetical protein